MTPVTKLSQPRNQPRRGVQDTQSSLAFGNRLRRQFDRRRIAWRTPRHVECDHTGFRQGIGAHQIPAPNRNCCENGLSLHCLAASSIARGESNGQQPSSVPCPWLPRFDKGGSFTHVVFCGRSFRSHRAFGQGPLSLASVQTDFPQHEKLPPFRAFRINLGAMTSGARHVRETGCCHLGRQEFGRLDFLGQLDIQFSSHWVTLYTCLHRPSVILRQAHATNTNVVKTYWWHSYQHHGERCLVIFNLSWLVRLRFRMKSHQHHW